LAVKARGRRAVKLVGFDASETLVNDLREGWIDALVVQDPFRMGYESVGAIALKLKGGSPPAAIDTGATLVQASDLKRPEVGDLLFPKVDLYLYR
jgi:ribose transport system substrate-binding protein